jgi:hypothetical protein
LTPSVNLFGYRVKLKSISIHVAVWSIFKTWICFQWHFQVIWYSRTKGQ